MYRTFFSVAAAAALAVATASISTASAATSDELTASMQAELQDATPAWKPEAAVYFVELTPDKKPTTNSQYGGALAVDAKGKMTCLVRARGGVVNE